MRFRAELSEIKQYVNECSLQNYAAIEENGSMGEFKSEILMDPMKSRAFLQMALEECVGKLEDNYRLVDEKVDERDFKWNDYDFQTFPFEEEPEPDGPSYNHQNYLTYLKRVRGVRKEYLSNHPPGVQAWKLALRNTMIFLGRRQRSIEGGWYLEASQNQSCSPFYLNTIIICKDNLFHAKVQMRNSKGADGDNELFTDVYEIPPVKLSKFLRKIGCTERYVTLVATKVNNKPRRFAIRFTDYYIPELYIKMSDVGKAQSCMSHDSDYYDLPDYEHPLLAYEESYDVCLALIEDLDSDDEFPYVARSIVRRRVDNPWCYSNIYGLEVVSRLEDWGIEEGSMDGIKLQRISSDDGGILAPYVDGTDNMFDDCGCYLECTMYGSFQSVYDTGRLGGNCLCECCENHVDEEYMHSVDGGNSSVCENCIERYYVWYDDQDTYIEERYACQLYDGFWAHQDDTVWSDYVDGYILDSEACYSDRCDDYLPCDVDEYDVIPLGEHEDDPVEDDEDDEDDE